MSSNLEIHISRDFFVNFHVIRTISISLNLNKTLIFFILVLVLFQITYVSDWLIILITILQADNEKQFQLWINDYIGQLI